MIHDLDIVQWLVGEEVEVTSIHAVGIAILTNKVDAANREIGVFFRRSRQHHSLARRHREDPQDAFLSTARLCGAGLHNQACLSEVVSHRQVQVEFGAGVHIKHLDVIDVEPLRAEIVSFLDALRDGLAVPVSGLDGRNALSLALRTLEAEFANTRSIQEYPNSMSAKGYFEHR